MKKKRIIVTCAFPYSNGKLHIGHLLEQIQADIWVRYQKIKGNIVYFLCSDDSHGTPIMLNHKKSNIPIKEIIKKNKNSHMEDFKKFNIIHDYYSSTHSLTNLLMSRHIYKKIKKKNFIEKKIIYQLYDPIEKIFLPDRFVEGICPFCKSKGQSGDSCDKCGMIYSSVKLIEPVSVLSRNRLILRKSKHLFFKISPFKKYIKKWIFKTFVSKKCLKKILEFIDSNLNYWNISRDHPYFGFKIPNESNKYFYVWFDAIIGYISLFKDFFKKNNEISFKDFWEGEKKFEFYQFIGKDILYFHSILFPSILECIKFRKPTKIFVHGHVVFNKRKISKSKGKSIKLNSYIKNNFDTDYLRYYYSTKISSEINDVNINAKNFLEKINSDLINKVINLASRTSKFINKIFNNRLSKKITCINLYNKFSKCSKKIEKYFEESEFFKVIKKIISLSKSANKYIDKKTPWKIKNKKKLHEICTMGIQLFRIIIIYLKPIVPNLAKNSKKFLNVKSLSWKDIKNPMKGNHKINRFNHLLKKIKEKDLKKMFKTI